MTRKKLRLTLQTAKTRRKRKSAVRDTIQFSEETLIQVTIHVTIRSPPYKASPVKKMNPNKSSSNSDITNTFNSTESDDEHIAFLKGHDEILEENNEVNKSEFTSVNIN